MRLTFLTEYITPQAMSPKGTRKSLADIHPAKDGSSDREKKKENREETKTESGAFLQLPIVEKGDGKSRRPSPSALSLPSNTSASASVTDAAAADEDISTKNEGDDLVRKLLNEITSSTIPPSDVGIADHSDVDVLTGRGGRTNNLPGNRYFRSIIHKYSPAYEVLETKSKPRVARKILELVRGRGGRFLRFDKSSKLYYEIGDASAREKISQSLRSITFQNRREAKVLEARRRRGEQKDKETAANGDNSIASAASSSSSFQVEQQKKYSDNETMDSQQPSQSQATTATPYPYSMDDDPVSFEDHQPSSSSSAVNYNPIAATAPKAVTTTYNGNPGPQSFQMHDNNLPSHNYGQQDGLNNPFAQTSTMHPSTSFPHIGHTMPDNNMRNADMLMQRATYLRALATSYESMAEARIYERDFGQRQELPFQQHPYHANNAAPMFNNNVQSTPNHQFPGFQQHRQPNYHTTNHGATAATNFTSNSGQSSAAVPPRPAFQAASTTPAAASLPFTDTNPAYFPYSNVPNMTLQMPQHNNNMAQHTHHRSPAVPAAAMTQHLPTAQHRSQNGDPSAFQASSSSCQHGGQSFNTTEAHGGPRTDSSIFNAGSNRFLETHQYDPIPFAFGSILPISNDTSKREPSNHHGVSQSDVVGGEQKESESSERI